MLQKTKVVTRLKRECCGKERWLGDGRW
jgi:hypothetical protein